MKAIEVKDEGGVEVSIEDEQRRKPPWRFTAARAEGRNPPSVAWLPVSSKPYASSVCLDSPDSSVSSGTLACMRKAISYWLMRVAISGSSTAALWIRFIACTVSTTSRCSCGPTPFGRER